MLQYGILASQLRSNLLLNAKEIEADRIQNGGKEGIHIERIDKKLYRSRVSKEHADTKESKTYSRHIIGPRTRFSYRKLHELTT